jgi:2-polyprenyl-6-methoxyphenol hydroxylase-like FAD-dependent oxidoreductase
VGAGGWDNVVRKAADAPFDTRDLHFAAGCTARMDEENGVRINLFKDGRFCRMINYGSMASVAVFGPAADIVTPRLIFEKVMKSDLAAVSSVLSYWTAFVPSPASAQFYSSPCAGKNWILLGEAAGHVHPISGESLRYALASAQFAAQAIECGEPRVFDGLWRDDYGKELEAAVKLKNKINKWRLSTELAFCAASKSSRVKNFMLNQFF